MNANYLLGEIN